MGKRGRAKGHRREKRKVSDAPSAVRTPEVHVTVATLSTGEISDRLPHDAELVKAALLYADHVTLASPHALMFGSVAGLAQPDSRNRRDALAATLAAAPGGEAVSMLYADLRRRRSRLSPQERLALQVIEDKLKTSGDEVARSVDRVLEEAGMPELAVAINSGALSIHLLGLEDVDPDELARTYSDKVTQGLVDVLGEAVSGKARTYPMFDDGAGNLVRSMIAEGLITDARTSRGKEMGAAGQLIGRMEAFPNAGMDVVLDVREQLRNPLSGFARRSCAPAARSSRRPGTPTSSHPKSRTYTTAKSRQRWPSSKRPCGN
jgi:hypothetical protein